MQSYEKIYVSSMTTKQQSRIFSLFRKALIPLASAGKSVVYFIIAGVFSQHVLVLVSPACFERTGFNLTSRRGFHGVSDKKDKTWN